MGRAASQSVNGRGGSTTGSGATITFDPSSSANLVRVPGPGTLPAGTLSPAGNATPKPGMMLYTSVNSIGVFAQAGVIPASIFFAGLTLATIVLILAWVHRAFRSLQDRV